MRLWDSCSDRFACATTACSRPGSYGVPGPRFLIWSGAGLGAPLVLGGVLAAASALVFGTVLLRMGIAGPEPGPRPEREAVP